MLLKDLAKVICTGEDKSRNMGVVVVDYTDLSAKVLWHGKAKDLRYMENIYRYGITDIVTDYEDRNETEDIYKKKIIRVRRNKE